MNRVYLLIRGSILKLPYVNYQFPCQSSISTTIINSYWNYQSTPQSSTPTAIINPLCNHQSPPQSSIPLEQFAQLDQPLNQRPQEESSLLRYIEKFVEQLQVVCVNAKLLKNMGFLNLLSIIQLKLTELEEKIESQNQVEV